jgi:hypothetical protein
MYDVLRLSPSAVFFQVYSQSDSELLYDRRFTANQFVLAISPLRLTTSNIIFQLNICGYSPYVTSSLMRGWVCRLQLLLVFASAVILRSESRGTHYQILLSQIRDSPNLEGQVPVSWTNSSFGPDYSSSARTTHRKQRFQQYLCCCMLIRCCGDVFVSWPLRREECFRAVR